MLCCIALRVDSQLSQRFNSMRATCHVFDAELFGKAKALSDHYDRDIAPTFPAQLLSFRSCFKAAISQQSSVQQIAKMLIVDNHSVTSAFGEVCIALLLFLTVPVTVASRAIIF